MGGKVAVGRGRWEGEGGREEGLRMRGVGMDGRWGAGKMAGLERCGLRPVARGGRRGREVVSGVDARVGAVGGGRKGGGVGKII